MKTNNKSSTVREQVFYIIIFLILKLTLKNMFVSLQDKESYDHITFTSFCH